MILKTSKIGPTCDKNVAPEGPWTSVLVPRALWGMWPHSGPQVDFWDFGAHLGGHFDLKIYEFWCRFSMCFRDAFWRGLEWLTESSSELIEVALVSFYD